jgi:hypothetical protein
MIFLAEFEKLSGARAGAVLGGLVGLGKGISDIPKRDRKSVREVVRDLALQSGGGALAGGALGHAGQKALGKVQRSASSLSRSTVQHARKELGELAEKKIAPMVEKRVRKGIAGAPREMVSSGWKKLKKFFRRK